MRRFTCLCVALSCVIMPILILVTACYINFTSPKFFYRYNENNSGPKFEETLSVSREDAYKAIDFMLDTVKGKNTADNISVTINGVKEPFFNGRELRHLYDISNIVGKGKLIALVAALISIPGIVLTIVKKEYLLPAKTYPMAQAAAFILIAVAAVIFACNPLMFITAFHRLFFGDSDNSWIFNPATDRIIHFFPKGIYRNMIVFAVTCFVAETFAFSVLSLITVRSARKKNRKE